MKKIAITLAALALTATAAVPAAAAHKPDTTCMQAGIATLKSVGAFSSVAANGLPIATAVDFGVTVRDADTDLSALPDPLPLSLILADHRAGANSIFVYPWDGCAQ
ncbi:hypothetical protein [Ornithinimicrobium cerasi]|uniref:Uncharacterized protein n=1 Tax=Ornithinimicrobium cerasi TaxID=2248773 RepID=A0A285VWH4_9MICO|nr:hypothetical protein [Ornithinimicrobium cerasi]SOC58394.1 hypothetical protein SAMN05421879_1344 [Ornithinimicrobium cerasi]